MAVSSIFNDMVELAESPRLDAVFHALGDATRRRMLRELTTGARTVSQLAEPFEMSLAAASKHIKALEGAGLIRREVSKSIGSHASPKAAKAVKVVVARLGNHAGTIGAAALAVDMFSGRAPIDLDAL